MLSLNMESRIKYATDTIICKYRISLHAAEANFVNKFVSYASCTLQVESSYTTKTQIYLY